jgi:hypothetical protein
MIKSSASESSQKVVEPIQEKPVEEASTSLEDLLKQEVVETPSKNELVLLEEKSEKEYWDDIGPMSGGLNLVNPDPPTAEQVEAELKAHKQLFPEQYKDGKYTGPSLAGVVNLHASNANTEPDRNVVLQVQKKVLEETTIARNTLIEQYEQEIKTCDVQTALSVMENSFKIEEYNPVHLPNAGNSEHADRTMLDHMMQSPMFCDDGSGLCPATDFTDGPTMLEECFGSNCQASGLEASLKK